ncbi:NAD(P)-dependent oxidoreductase [Blastococcus sp. TF02A-26]|nr:NAD(P)-dependent oxidoreductase [Blastococcus sp. TF02A-26]
MARRIVEDGIPTVLWARRQETLDAYSDTAAEYASSPAELGSRVDVACVCVVDDAGVEEVVAGPDGLLSTMASGGVVVIHSTVHPDTCRRLAEQARARGIALVDAPVSGGGMAAEARKLLVMVGGDAETLERVRPVFATYADPIVHLGPVGAGQRAKLINNLMLTANLGVLESAYALAKALEVDPGQLSTVLSHGSGNSFAVNVLRTPDFVLGPLGAMAGPLLQKDARLVVDLATAAGAEPGTVLVAADAALDSMGCQR